MRIASFAQESTRYCNYSADKFGGEITVIQPYWATPEIVDGREYYLTREFNIWFDCIRDIENNYFTLLKEDLPAQAARGVLPNDLKTEINVKANLREWRQIFKLRTSPAAHPDMRRVMIPLLKELQERIPIIFDDIKSK